MDTAGNKQNSVIVGNCLACGGLVRIPTNSKSSVTVRCPHCSESFYLHQILEDSIPELEIVTDPAVEKVIPHFDRAGVQPADPSQPPREKFVVPSQLSKGAKRNRRRRGRKEKSKNANPDHSSSSPRGDRSDDSALTDFNPDDISHEETDSHQNSDLNFAELSVSDGTPATENSSFSVVEAPSQANRESVQPVRRPHSSQQSRRRKSAAKPNSMLEALKVVIGGVMAFPIAYLLLLWFFNQDPLNLAPSIGGIMPFAVPAELRDQPEALVLPDQEPDALENDPVTLPSDDLDSLIIPDFDPDKIDNDGLFE